MSLMGKTVKDKITGFKGVVTGYCQYLTGCNQALIQPPCGKDGKMPESYWVDEQRLDVQGRSIVRLDNGTTPGFDKPAPKR